MISRDGRLRVLVVTLACGVSCGGDDTSSTTPPQLQGVVSTEPDPPPGYGGDPGATLPISPAEQAALDQALAVYRLRNGSQQASDRGFAAAISSPQTPKGTVR